MIGENELNELEAELLERTRRSFYRQEKDLVGFSSAHTSLICRNGASLGEETSKTLDYLLFESGYNRRVRPNNGAGPVVVNVNLAIR